MAGKLYVVGTPIGNLSDFSPRGAATLSEVDFIAAEDTRVTVKLLNHLGISKPMLSYYEHNKRERGGEIMERILAGENCALVSDAGMPAISDPGEELVALAYELGVSVESVPGPTAMATALSISGMKSGRFCFEGFLSVNKPSRKAHLKELEKEPRTMVFYEAPHKLPATLKDMYASFGDRKIAIARELTKLHEEVIHTTLSQAASLYDDEKKARGEFVLIIDGYTPEKEEEFTLEQAVEIAREYVEKGNPTSVAAKLAAGDTGFKKGDIYKLLTK